VTVSRDAGGLRKQVDAFVKGYNDLVGWVNDQRTAAIDDTTGNVGRDPVVTGLHTDLRTAILGQHGAGTIKSLAAVGIGFSRDGLMTVDTTAFQNAVSADAASVQELFAGAGGTKGAFDDLSALLTRYTSSDGLVREAQDRIDGQVKSISNRMDVLDAQLTMRRDALQKEFIAADQAMQQLNAQVNSLTTLNGQYRLF
jgi:flagellar hook-associated protein 2